MNYCMPEYLGYYHLWAMTIQAENPYLALKNLREQKRIMLQTTHVEF